MIIIIITITMIKLFYCCYYYSCCGSPPWLVTSTQEKGEGMGVAPAPPPHKNLPATETTAKDLTSPDRRSEEDHADCLMTAGDQRRVDASSLIADILTPKRRTRVGFFNVGALCHSGRLPLAIREMNNYNLAIMGIAEARWTGAGKKILNSGETIIWSGRQDNKHQEAVALIIASKYANTLLQLTSISKRQLCVRSNASHIKLSIIVAFAPI